MAVPLGAKLNEDPCPITEQLFGQLRRASPPDAVEIAMTLPDPQRARLATFCYYRRHLHALGHYAVTREPILNVCAWQILLQKSWSGVTAENLQNFILLPASDRNRFA